MTPDQMMGIIVVDESALSTRTVEINPLTSKRWMCPHCLFPVNYYKCNEAYYWLILINHCSHSAEVEERRNAKKSGEEMGYEYISADIH